MERLMDADQGEFVLLQYIEDEEALRDTYCADISPCWSHWSSHRDMLLPFFFSCTPDFHTLYLLRLKLSWVISWDYLLSVLYSCYSIAECKKKSRDVFIFIRLTYYLLWVYVRDYFVFNQTAWTYINKSYSPLNIFHDSGRNNIYLRECQNAESVIFLFLSIVWIKWIVTILYNSLWCVVFVQYILLNGSTVGEGGTVGGDGATLTRCLGWGFSV